MVFREPDTQTLVHLIFLFVAGGALRFKALMLGGCINWVIAVVALFVPFEYQILLLSLAVLSGYIIPGYMLKLNYKKGA